MPHPTTPPDALLLVSTACPHCSSVLEGLAVLLKEGLIGRLEAVNVAVRAERAAELGVRSVPWLRLGPFELDGVLTPAELRQWAEQAGSEAGMAEYFLHLLKTGRRAKVEAMARQEPARLLALVRLLGDEENGMAVRLGIGAVLEEFQGSEIAKIMIPGLGGLTRHPDALTRADACHYLSLIGGDEIAPYLRACLDDEDAQVREVAQDALDELDG